MWIDSANMFKKYDLWDEIKRSRMISSVIKLIDQTINKEAHLSFDDIFWLTGSQHFVEWIKDKMNIHFKWIFVLSPSCLRKQDPRLNHELWEEFQGSAIFYLVVVHLFLRPTSFSNVTWSISEWDPDFHSMWRDQSNDVYSSRVP